MLRSGVSMNSYSWLNEMKFSLLAVLKACFSMELFAVLYAWDCVGNAFSGGSHRHTISARIGWRAATYGSWRWRLTQWIVNWGFKPEDGLTHCFDAYQAEIQHDFVHDDNNWRYSGVLVLVVVFAVPIGIILRARTAFIWCRGKLRSNFN